MAPPIGAGFLVAGVVAIVAGLLLPLVLGSFSEEIARHQRDSREFALVLLDLDGFKAVNERLGHLEGDRLLAEVGAAMRDAVRAEEVAARLRARIARCGLGHDESRQVSATTGFAMFPADGSTPEALLGFADRDLFAAKHGRRVA